MMEPNDPMPDDGAAEFDSSAPIMPGAEPPLEVRLKPGTELHRKVVQKLRARLDLSYRNLSGRYGDWDRVDEHQRMYINLSRQVRKGDKTDVAGKREIPFDRSIVIPMSYAIHEVRKTQLFSLFGRREPFIQLQGRGPEDMKPAKTMEALMDYDYGESNGAVALYSLIQDTDKYGMGIILDEWQDISGWKTVMQPVPMNPFQSMGVKMGLLPAPPPVPTKEWGTVKEFNRWMPVDPFNFWPDPRVSVSNLQEGEFVGHRTYRGFLSLQERSKPTGPYFNLDKLKETGNTGATGESARLTGRSRFAADQFTLKDNGDDKDKGYYTLDHLQVKIIPKDWELGPEDKPEIWWFTLADERTIIRAHKSAYEHGQFTYSVAEINPDPHTIANPGVIENLDGLQRSVDWLYNSHMENVRKFINNELIFSPRFIELEDVMKPGPGRWIRLTPEGEDAIASGRNIGEFYAQMNVADVTKGHMELVSQLYEFANRMSGASDQMQAAQTSGDPTLGELEMLNAGANQRLGVSARMIDAMAITPLARRAVANRQQFTSIEQFIRIAGDLAKEIPRGAERVLVKPNDIQGNFDYVPHSAATPSDPARMAQVYQQILQTLGSFPQLADPAMSPDGKYIDTREVFNELVRTMGVRNVEEFYRQGVFNPMTGTFAPAGIAQAQMAQAQAQMGAPQVMPDEQVQQQVQAGNMVPVA